MRHLIDPLDFSVEETQSLLDLACDIEKNRSKYAHICDGKKLAKVEPGDKVIVAVTVIDERVKAEDFGITGNNVKTNRIHATMTQGAFTISSLPP